MRTTFVSELLAHSQEYRPPYLVVGDVGYAVVEPFAEAFPMHYLNCGIMEQTMTGIAAGMALEGERVFTYSIANFNTMRALEQIRNDIAYDDLDVTIVSVGGGFVYGSAGYSHHAVQDISVMGSLPNMRLLLPASAHEVSLCMAYAFSVPGVKYLRLGKNDSSPPLLPTAFCGNFQQYGDDATIVIVSAGGILDVARAAQELLAQRGIPVAVYTVPIIDAQFADHARSVFMGKYLVITLEEGISRGGLGGYMHEALEGTSIRVRTFGVKRDDVHAVGSQGYLREYHGIDAAQVAEEIRRIVYG